MIAAYAHSHAYVPTRLQFLPKQPVLVSAGADNALRMWLLDGADGSARLLRSREGHKAPPTRIRFVGVNLACRMLCWEPPDLRCLVQVATPLRPWRTVPTQRRSRSSLLDRSARPAAMRGDGDGG